MKKTLNSKKDKKAYSNIIRKSLRTLIIIFIIILVLYNVVYLVTNVMTSNTYIQMFGMSLCVMKDNSMQDAIQKNAFLIIKKTNPKEIKIGDIVAYRNSSNNKNSLSIERITNIYSENGKTYYTTQTEKGYYNSLEEKTFDNIQGKVIVNIPIIGVIFLILQSKITSIVILLLLIFRYMYKRELERRKIIRRKKKDAFCV